nr:mitofilin family membrane protein [Epibacterium ulvae]
MIEELSALGVDVPADLADRAADGVLTLSALTEGFAPSARDALATVRDENKAGGGLLDYVNRHLGARSVAPRDGDDADAILSRVEAAVRAGDLEVALQETSSLPEAAASAMADWIGAVVARQETLTAAETLSQSLNAN